MKKIIQVLFILFSTNLFAQSYTVTVNTDGNGSVTMDPLGGSYSAGDTVTLTANPNEGYVFNYWNSGVTGINLELDDSKNPKLIIIKGNRNYTANFMKNDLPAFPGAEGAGAYTVGGRGGAVIEVTNLNSSGTGSFREACLTEGTRTIVFRVGGTIDLGGETINIVGDAYDNITIAGQTAPGGGIQIKNGSVVFAVNQVVIRYIRFRLGPIAGSPDALAVGGAGKYNRKRNIILDHVSVYWGVDETLELGTYADNVTLQWSIVAEGLQKSLYDNPSYCDPWYDDGKVVYWTHSRGLMIAAWGRNISIHHNIIYNSYKRSPVVQASDADVVNNIMVNKNYQAYVQSFKGEVRVNWVGNYFRTHDNICPPIRVYNFDMGYDKLSGCYYKDNYDAYFRKDDTDPEINIRILQSFLDDPKGDGHIQDMAEQFLFNYDSISTQSVHNAYSLVLDKAGANFPFRDSADKRVVKYIKSGATPKSFVNHPDNVGGWPTLASGKAPLDSDHDGMADAWEIINGLDTTNVADRNETNLSSDGYTNLEVYLNYIVEQGL